MQALTRKHPSTRARVAALNVSLSTCDTGLLAPRILRCGEGELMGKVVKHRTADALVGFLEDVARYPDTQVYVVWDNLNILKEGKTKRCRPLIFGTVTASTWCSRRSCFRSIASGCLNEMPPGSMTTDETT